MSELVSIRSATYGRILNYMNVRLRNRFIILSGKILSAGINGYWLLDTECTYSLVIFLTLLPFFSETDSAPPQQKPKGAGWKPKPKGAPESKPDPKSKPDTKPKGSGACLACHWCFIKFWLTVCSNSQCSISYHSFWHGMLFTKTGLCQSDNVLV